uniref:Uncharacterized protein n=1 Tax=Anguilla anguilla TaxID=7936 RepID=A0A0E9T4P6_ANGAN
MDRPPHEQATFLKRYRGDTKTILCRRGRHPKAYRWF